MLIGGVGYSYYSYEADPPEGKSLVYIDVASGQSINLLVPTLVKSGVVKSGWLFKLYLKLHHTVAIKPGVYSFRKPSSFASVLKEFSTNPEEYVLKYLPGMTLAQLADLVGSIPGYSSSHFLSTLESGKLRSTYELAGSNNLEGLLAPDTYFISPGETDSQIIEEMIQEFQDEMKQIGLMPNSIYGGLSAYQVITIASLARAEAKYPSDEQKVVRVILNRLALNMPLQLDSTVRFALGDPPEAPTIKELYSVQSPYNTYTHTGLPPGPIGAVTENDVKYVLNPVKGSWLYFVVISPDGHEAFANTYQQQLYNEKIARQNNAG